MAARSGVFTGLLTAATVAALIYANWTAATGTIDTSANMPPMSALSPIADDQAKPEAKPLALADLNETLSRPLFNTDRRPAPPRIASKDRSADETDQAHAKTADTASVAKLKLLGTMRDGSNGNRALIQAENATEANWLSVGSEVAGWRLTGIDGDRVTVEASGARSILTLYPTNVQQSTAE